MKFTVSLPNAQFGWLIAYFCSFIRNPPTDWLDSWPPLKPTTLLANSSVICVWSNSDWFSEPLTTAYNVNKSSFPQLSPVSVRVGIFSAPLSFQKEFSCDEKDDPAKSAKDIDVSLLANLPKGEWSDFYLFIFFKLFFTFFISCWKWLWRCQCSHSFSELPLCNSSLFARLELSQDLCKTSFSTRPSFAKCYVWTAVIMLHLFSWQGLFNAKCKFQ